MGTLAEYSMLMTAIAVVLSLMIPNAIEPFQARMMDVRNAALTTSNYRLVASLENTSVWITEGEPKWNNGMDPLSYSLYSVIGTRTGDRARFALSPRAKMGNSRLIVPGKTCANFYAPDVTPEWEEVVTRVFSIPCEPGTYEIFWAGEPHGIPRSVVTVECHSDGACEIQWRRTVNGVIVRESVQFVP